MDEEGANKEVVLGFQEVWVSEFLSLGRIREMATEKIRERIQGMTEIMKVTMQEQWVHMINLGSHAL